MWFRSPVGNVEFVVEKVEMGQALLQGFKHLSVLLKDKDPIGAKLVTRV
jgi:hypothetical protein